MKGIKTQSCLNVLLWIIYVALLGVLTPHTAWALRLGPQWAAACV